MHTYYTFYVDRFLVPNKNIGIVEERVSKFTTRSTLIIRSLSQKHFRTYKCSAKNTIGKTSKTVKVYGMK